jgi:spore germination cell wall hydrolase CwlJ-like protein
MAARWVGLSGPHTKKSARVAAIRVGVRHALHESLHALGAAGLLLMAAAMNFALYPDALASVVTGQRPITELVRADTAPAARTFTEEDVHLLAATAWGEARSEGDDGMRAVAHVMVNRIGERFGDDLKSVVLAPKQFSAWNLGDPNRPLVQHPERYARGGMNLVTWQRAQQIAREVLSGQSVDPTGGALFYHTRAIHPWWQRFGRAPKVIGAHVFYRDVPNRPGLITRYDPNAPARLITVAEHRPAHAAGPRAGRVHGVIQHATSTAPAPPTEASAVEPHTPSPEVAAALSQLPTSTSY